MAYSNRNKRVRDYLVLKIVEAHYVPGVTTYSGILREYVYKHHPMDYKTFMKIVNDPDSGRLLREGPEAFAEEDEKEGSSPAEERGGRQISLLEVPGVVEN